MDIDKHLSQYYHDGFISVDAVYNVDEINEIIHQVEQYSCSSQEGIVFESDDEQVRGIHGCHLYNDFFQALTADSRLFQLAQRVLGSDIYVHQFKINFKRAHLGKCWPWHQDFTYWHLEDGMPAPEAISIAIFLDEVTYFNGPLTFLRTSHQLNLPIPKVASAGDWRATVNDTLKYDIDMATLAKQGLNSSALAAPLGKAGDGFIFHPNVIHGSGPNMSFCDRRILIITYNLVSNQPAVAAMTRPEFMANQDFTPLIGKPLVFNR